MRASYRVLMVTGASGADLLRSLQTASDVAVWRAEGRDDVLRSPLPHVVVLDVDHTGAEFLEWLRSHPAYRSTPVIALTARREAAAIERLYQLGANTCLLTPLDPAAMDEIAAGIGTYASLLRNAAAAGR